MLLPLRTVSVTTAASRLAGQPITAHQRKSVHPVVQPVSRMNQRFTGRVTVRTGGAIRMPQAAPPLDLAERRRYDAQEPAPPSRGGIRPLILLLDAAPEESAPSATPSDNASCRRGRNPGPVRGPVLGGPALRTGVCTTHSSTNRVTAGSVLRSSRPRGSGCRLRLDGATDQGAELAVDTTPRSRLFTVKAQLIAAESLATTTDAEAVDERRDRRHWNSPTGSVPPKR
jgi:hypothetical protein